MLPLDETQIIGSASLSTCPLAKGPQQCGCTAQPITSLRTAAGWMGRLNAKSAAVASRVMLLEIIWSGFNGSHRYRRLRGSSFCLVHKKRKIFCLLQLQQSALGNVHLESLYSVSASLIQALWEAGAGRRKVKHLCLSLQNGFFFEYGWNLNRSNL